MIILFCFNSLLYSFITSLSALMEVISKCVISRFCHDVALLIPIYAWLLSKIDISNNIVAWGNVRPCVLWTVRANAFCKGNWVCLAGEYSGFLLYHNVDHFADHLIFF